MPRFLLAIEEGVRNYSPYPPGLWGHIGTTKIKERAEANMQQATCVQIESRREDSLPPPETAASAEHVVVR